MQISIRSTGLQHFGFVLICIPLLIDVSVKRATAEQIDVAVILERWRESRVSNVRVELVNVVELLTENTDDPFGEIIDPNHDDGRTRREMEFRYLHDVGMKLETLTGIRDASNLLGGRGVNVTGPLKESRPYTVSIYDTAERATIMRDAVTYHFRIWVDPLSSPLGARLSSRSGGALDVQSDPELGTIATVRFDERPSVEEAVLSKRFGWRPVRLKRTAGPRRASLVQVDYYHDDDGELCMSGWGKHKFDPSTGRVRLKAEVEVTSVNFGSVRRPDLDVPIPAFFHCQRIQKRGGKKVLHQQDRRKGFRNRPGPRDTIRPGRFPGRTREGLRSHGRPPADP